MILRLSLFSIVLFVSSCQESTNAQQIPDTEKVQRAVVNKQGSTVEQRFSPPANTKRVSTSRFGKYLRGLPLKPDGTTVYLYNGRKKGRQDVHAAVINMDVGKRDLQQCADAVMRLRAEYLYKARQYHKIHFNFTNGFKAAYSKWREGYKISVRGNNVVWVSSRTANDSYESFREYLNIVFAYAGTLSLSKEMEAVAITDMQIGDVFIKGGSPGHAVIVVDMAEGSDGEKYFMLAQSYMPAQDIHILKNKSNSSYSPWYRMSDIREYVATPEWIFSVNDLKRFVE